MTIDPLQPTPGDLKELARKSKRLQARAAARSPKRIGDIVAQIQARRGFGQKQSAALLEEAWREAVGPMLAPHTHVGALRRGVLEIVVESSTILQEMTFQKKTLATKIVELAPELGVRALRFRVGPLPSTR